MYLIVKPYLKLINVYMGQREAHEIVVMGKQEQQFSLVVKIEYNCL